jgi:hypothetical protein
MDIIYKKHNTIDKQQWDKLIDAAYNSMPYAYSWYLDIVSPGWDALVVGDYEMVMPLTYGKKWGISYLYQPYFTQQLGVFSNKKLNYDEINTFISEISAKFKYIDVCFNQLNTSVLHISKALALRNNQEILLNTNYESIYSEYSYNARKNIRKAQQHKLYSNEHISVDDFMGSIENMWQ